MRSWTIRRKLLTQLRARTGTTDPGQKRETCAGCGEPAERADDILEFAQAAGGFGIFELNFRNSEIRGTSQFFELIGLPQGADSTLSLETLMITVHPQDLEAVTDVLGNALASGLPYSHEYRNLRASGEIRWLCGRGQAVPDGDGGSLRIVGTLTDVTDLKHLEVRLRSATESLNVAQTAAGVATFDFDLRNNQHTGSDNLYELRGVPRSTPLEDTDRMLARVHVQDILRLRDALLTATVSDPDYRCDYRVCHADGRERWISEKGRVTFRGNGQVARVIGALVDITDLKLAQAALGSIEGRLERALRGTQDGLWEVDLQRQTNWYGYRFAELLGYTTEELGTSRDYFHSLVHPDDRELFHAHVDAHLKDNTPYDLEFRVLHKAGHYEWMRARAQADRDS